MNKDPAIYHDMTIDVTKSKVFEALTNPNLLVDWWPLKCTGKPQVGEMYNLFFGNEYDWYGRVIECKDDTLFKIKMTQSDDDWNDTIFGFKLSEHNSNTRLSFSHVGWKNCNREFRNTSFCWAILLKGLKNYLENNTVVPFELRE